MNCKSFATHKREREIIDNCAVDNIAQSCEINGDKFSENCIDMPKEHRRSNKYHELSSQYEINTENDNNTIEHTKYEESESVFQNRLFECTRSLSNSTWYNNTDCQMQEELFHLSAIDKVNRNLEISIIKDVLQRTHLVEMRDKEMLEWLTWLEEWLHVGDTIGSTHELCSSWSDLRFIVIDILKQIPWWRLIDTSIANALTLTKHQSKFTKEKCCQNENNQVKKSKTQISKNNNEELAHNLYKYAYRVRDKWHRPIQLAIEKVCLTLINQSQHAISGVLEIIFRPFALPMPVSDGVKRIIPIDSVIRIFDAIANKYSTFYLWNLFAQCVVSLLPKRRWNEVRSHLAATVLLMSLALEEFVPVPHIAIKEDNNELELSEQWHENNYWNIPCSLCINTEDNKLVTKEVYFPELAESYLRKMGVKKREHVSEEKVTNNIVEEGNSECRKGNNSDDDDNNNNNDEGENAAAESKSQSCREKINLSHTNEKICNVKENMNSIPKEEKVAEVCIKKEIIDTNNSIDNNKKLHAYGGVKANRLLSYQAPLIAFTLNWLLDVELTLDRVDGCEVSLYTPSSPISSRASSRASFSVVHANHNTKRLTHDNVFYHRNRNSFNNYLYTTTSNRNNNINNINNNYNNNNKCMHANHKNVGNNIDYSVSGSVSGSVSTNLSKTNSIIHCNSEKQKNINVNVKTEILNTDEHVEKIFTPNALSHLRILRTCTAYIFVKLSLNIKKLNEEAVKLSSLEWWQDGLTFHLQLLLRSNNAVCLHYLIPSLVLVSTDDDAIDLLHKVISTVTKGHLPIKLTRGETTAQLKFTNSINGNNNNNTNNNSVHQSAFAATNSNNNNNNNANIRQSNRMRMVMRSALPQVIPLNQRIQAATFIYPMYKFFHSRIGHNEGIRKRLLKCVMQEVRNSRSSRTSSTLPEANSTKSSYGGSSYFRPYDKKSTFYGITASTSNKLAEVLFVQYAAISELTHQEIMSHSLHTPAVHHATPLQHETVSQLQSEEREQAIVEESNLTGNSRARNSNARKENSTKNACELTADSATHDNTVHKLSHKNVPEVNKEKDIPEELEEFVNKYSVNFLHEEENEQLSKIKHNLDEKLLHKVETVSQIEEENIHHDNFEQEHIEIDRRSTTSANSVECNSHHQWNWSLMYSEGLLRPHLLNQCPWQQHLTQLITNQKENLQ